MDVFTVEALALKFGLSLAQRLGCNRLIINSDNLDVIDIMKDGRLAGATVAIFDDCFHYACDFIITRFKQCNKEANKVAHELALVCVDAIQTVFNPFSRRHLEPSPSE